MKRRKRQRNNWKQAAVLAAVCFFMIGGITLTLGAVHAARRRKAEATEASEAANRRAELQQRLAEMETSPENLISIDSDSIPTETSLTAQNEQELTELQKSWLNYIMPRAEEYINVRRDRNTDSEIVGKIFNGDRAEVLEKGDEWSLVASGNVKGYVKNEYCRFGLDALEWAKKNCDAIFRVEGEGLRIRAEESEDSVIIGVVTEGDTLTIDSTVEQVKEGWRAVYYNDQTGYVKADYGELAYRTGKGVTIEEEEAAIRAQKEAEEAASRAAEEARKAAEAAAKEKQRKAEEEEKRRKAEELAKSKDTKLLASIIQCEAGGESYEGKVAVGAVIMNRVKSKSFPNSISGVVYQGGQFTPVATGRLANVLENGPTASCRKAALEALQGRDNTGGALYFGTKAHSPAKATIGGHTFY
ncbi:MAG: cell wall hydrolase [[Clostridium] aminophilum]|uniref:cell wall hydrolase n=1 Tax=[Clostridium] aminophilum TaxID=1526 RepID=UPI0026F2AAFC|nr:cell wall hydrolase [[Clostridium] aminophilum]MDD6195838.1 cell wall hydrolase [[Clostridium] aminophilum]